MRNFWHTNRLNWRSCATPPLFLQKNEKILAHKLPKLKIVCHASPIPPKKREIFGTQIAQIRNRVPLLTNLRRKMSNKRDRRRKGVIYPGQSGTGRSQNTFFTETGKEPNESSNEQRGVRKQLRGTLLVNRYWFLTVRC